MIEIYTPPTGACCIDLSCQTLSEKDCIALNGVYNGDETICSTASCDGTIQCVCAETFSVGDTVVCLVDAPWGNPGLTIGDIGTVICGGYYSGGSILVQWENFVDGSGLNNCDCNPADLGEGTDRWWVTCEMIEITDAPTCAADFNNDGIVNVSDLLELIGAWGVCP
ncbi:MAG TPA: hypothetical protein EYO31_05055 [Phycisphaerales bacterium]|nr:hypothetical protein [Phycisphaerales bacterium]